MSEKVNSGGDASRRITDSTGTAGIERSGNDRGESDDASVQTVGAASKPSLSKNKMHLLAAGTAVAIILPMGVIGVNVLIDHHKHERFLSAIETQMGVRDALPEQLAKIDSMNAALVEKHAAFTDSVGAHVMALDAAPAGLIGVEVLTQAREGYDRVENKLSDARVAAPRVSVRTFGHEDWSAGDHGEILFSAEKAAAEATKHLDEVQKLSADNGQAEAAIQEAAVDTATTYLPVVEDALANEGSWVEAHAQADAAVFTTTAAELRVALDTFERDSGRDNAIALMAKLAAFSEAGSALKATHDQVVADEAVAAAVEAQRLADEVAVAQRRSANDWSGGGSAWNNSGSSSGGGGGGNRGPIDFQLTPDPCEATDTCIKNNF